jgi:regulation of enolase protein 1 (concanavalin A-like superfamily)
LIMVKKLITIFLIAAVMASMIIQPVSAAYQPELPSLYETFSDYFMFGSFHGMSNFFGSSADVRNLLQHHFNSWCPANEFKPSSLLDLSTASSTYNTIYNEVNADGVIDEEEAQRLYEANTTIVLGSTSQQLNFLNQVRTFNETRGPEDQVKVKAHTLFWHNLSQQPEAFFHEGFSNSRPWASKEVMLARIDSYVQKVFERFAPYNDVIYSWDVVNEAIDDFSGFIRNEADYQEGRWGRIFKRPDIADRNERLYEEAVWVRQAFKSAAKYVKQYDLDWSLVYNDFYDADKDYEPKLSSTVEMLKPIYEQMKEDGVTFAIGLQNRNATSLSLDVFKDMYNKFAEICDEIQLTESDTRSDLVANPNYSRDVLPYYLSDGTKNPEWTYSTWQNTPDAHVALVRSGWTAAMANQPEIQREQADWMADQFDFLLENSKGNGGKITVAAYDGVNDSSTFNSNKGAHLFMAADNAGNTSYTAKMSYYAVIGSVARFELKKKMENIPDDSSEDIYTPDSWSKYAAARQAAEDVLGERIYDIDGVNDVKEADSDLTEALEGLTETAVSLNGIKVDGTPISGFAPGIHDYVLKALAGPVPQITAEAADPAAKVSIAQAEGLPGKAVITVSSEDDAKQTVYTVSFDVDTTLSSLKVDGNEISGFSPDKYSYDVSVTYGALPDVTAVASDPGAAVEIIPPESVPGQAAVEVSIGSAKTVYTINFTADSTLSSLKVNGIQVSGFSPDIYTYNVYIPSGVTPVVSVTPKDPNAPVAITQADTVPGQAVAVIGSGISQVVYTINFSNRANGNDEFDSPVLDTTLWYWVNEDPDTWSLTSNPGYMTISPRAGDIYGGSTDGKNILLQDAPGDWTIETKVTSSIRPYSTYTQGGIIAYQDLDNYIKLDWEMNNSGLIIQACREVNGSASATSVNGDVVGDDNTIWLRMVKSGNVYSTYYSVNGTDFVQVGSGYTLDFTNVQAGLIAINGAGTTTDVDMKFDYFHSTAGVFDPLPDITSVAITGDSSVDPESDFTLGINLNIPDKTAYAEDITVSYDPAVFEYVNTAKAAENVEVLVSEPAGDGAVRIIAANIGGISGKDVPLLNISFRAKSGVSSVTSNISVTDAKLGIMPEGTEVLAGQASKAITVRATASANKDALRAAIDEAQSLYDSAVVGTADGCYLKSDKDAFKTAIDAALAVYEKEDASQAEVDSAAAALSTAIAVFKASVITASTGDINSSPTVDIGDLAIIAYYYGADSDDENWETAKIADINKDGRVDIEDLAFVASRLPN